MSLFTRRALFQSATAAVAAEAGVRLLSSPLLVRSPLLADLRRAVLQGDGRALADAPGSATANPLFVFTCHAKWDSAGWLNRPNQVGTGIKDNVNCAASKVYSAHGLTVQFGDYLKDVEANVGFAICPISTANAGNHDYDGLRTTMNETGCLASFVNQQTGGLLSLFFASVGSADGATACFGAGGQQLITYASVATAAGSLLKAVDPLTDLAPPAKTLLARLNDRVTKDPSFRNALEDIANRLSSASDPLQAAATRAAARPSAALTATNQMTNAVLLANNPFIPQLDAAFALIDRGLTNAVDISGANSDPNAGGDHAGTGGTNVAYGARSPNELKSCVAQALAYIYAKYPNALCAFNSDGGRSADGGDTGNYEGIVTGPKSLINTVFVNSDSRKDSASFGSTPGTVTLSDGTTAVPNQANLMATVAKAAGIKLGTYAYIPQMLVTG